MISKFAVLVSIILFSSLSQAAGGGGGSSPYLTLTPPFVVNIQDGDNSRFLQITTEVRMEDPEKESVITHHMPMIRHFLLMLFSEQTKESISTLEGKETLREEALEVLQTILEEETGDALVKNIYFTGFIVQ